MNEDNEELPFSEGSDMHFFSFPSAALFVGHFFLSGSESMKVKDDGDGE